MTLFEIVVKKKVYLPHKQNIKVSCRQIKALSLSVGEAKAHGEDGQGQGEQPCQHKQHGPYGETGRQGTKIMISYQQEFLIKNTNNM